MDSIRNMEDFFLGRMTFTSDVIGGYRPMRNLVYLALHILGYTYIIPTSVRKYSIPDVQLQNVSLIVCESRHILGINSENVCLSENP